MQMTYRFISLLLRTHRRFRIQFLYEFSSGSVYSPLRTHRRFRIHLHVQIDHRFRIQSLYEFSSGSVYSSTYKLTIGSLCSSFYEFTASPVYSW